MSRQDGHSALRLLTIVGVSLLSLPRVSVSVTADVPPGSRDGPRVVTSTSSATAFEVDHDTDSIEPPRQQGRRARTISRSPVVASSNEGAKNHDTTKQGHPRTSRTGYQQRSKPIKQYKTIRRDGGKCISTRHAFASYLKDDQRCPRYGEIRGAAAAVAVEGISSSDTEGARSRVDVLTLPKQEAEHKSRQKGREAQGDIPGSWRENDARGNQQSQATLSEEAHELSTGRNTIETADPMERDGGHRRMAKIVASFPTITSAAHQGVASPGVGFRDGREKEGHDGGGWNTATGNAAEGTFVDGLSTTTEASLAGDPVKSDGGIVGEGLAGEENGGESPGASSTVVQPRKEAHIESEASVTSLRDHHHSRESSSQHSAGPHSVRGDRVAGFGETEADGICVEYADGDEHRARTAGAVMYEESSEGGSSGDEVMHENSGGVDEIDAAIDDKERVRTVTPRMEELREGRGPLTEGTGVNLGDDKAGGAVGDGVTGTPRWRKGGRWWHKRLGGTGKGGEGGATFVIGRARWTWISSVCALLAFGMLGAVAYMQGKLPHWVSFIRRSRREGWAMDLDAAIASARSRAESWRSSGVADSASDFGMPDLVSDDDAPTVIASARTSRNASSGSGGAASKRRGDSGGGPAGSDAADTGGGVALMWDTRPKSFDRLVFDPVLGVVPSGMLRTWARAERTRTARAATVAGNVGAEAEVVRPGFSDESATGAGGGVVMPSESHDPVVACEPTFRSKSTLSSEYSPVTTKRSERKRSQPLPPVRNTPDWYAWRSARQISVQGVDGLSEEGQRLAASCVLIGGADVQNTKVLPRVASLPRGSADTGVVRSIASSSDYHVPHDDTQVERGDAVGEETREKSGRGGADRDTGISGRDSLPANRNSRLEAGVEPPEFAAQMSLAKFPEPLSAHTA